MELAENHKLKKELSLFGVYTLATGATLSSGFFLLPGLAATEAGPALVLAYLLAIVPFIPGILSKIELATAMPRAGGAYYFIDRSLGPMAGTIGGLGTWCSLMLKTSFALIGIGAYLARYVPDLPMGPVAALLAVFFGAVNLLGASKTSKLQSALVVVLLAGLVWFSGMGVTHVKAQHFADFLGAGWEHLFAAAGLVCVSYMGVTKVASVAEEVKNPERNLPLGILLALLTAVLVYGVGTSVIVGVLDPHAEHVTLGDGALRGNLTSVADAASMFAGDTGALIMTIAAVLAFLSVANAGVLSASRYPLAMSRDKLIPDFLSKLNRFRTPWVGVAITVAVIVLLVTVLDPTRIAKLASAFQLMLFGLNCLAVIVMRESHIESYDPGFKSIGYPWMQVFGIFAPISFIIVMGWLPVLFTLSLVVIGVLWYVYYARHRVTRGGAIYHLFARLGQRRFEGLDRELRGILKEKGLREHDPYDELIARAGVIDDTSGEFEQVVYRASVELAAQLPLTAEQMAQSFMEGTQVGATPVSKGVALPHLRIIGLETPLLVIARSKPGLTIHVVEDKPHLNPAKDQDIHAVVFLISPEEAAAQHLRLLAAVAQQIDDTGFMERWLAATDEQSLKEALLREDRYLTLVLSEEGPGNKLIGQTVRDLRPPEGAMLAHVRRGVDVLMPHGDTTFRESDRVFFIGLPDALDKLKATLGIA